MSQLISDFLELVDSREKRNTKLILLEYDEDYDILQPIKLHKGYTPNNKELRLALDLIDTMYPLFKKDINTKADALRDVLKFNISKERVIRLKSHKKLLFKSVITIKNNKVIIKRVRK